MEKDCPNKKDGPSSPKKLSAKDLIMQIRAMTKEEKNDFVNLMMDEKDEAKEEDQIDVAPSFYLYF